jgi:hypothetical protein
VPSIAESNQDIGSGVMEVVGPCDRRRRRNACHRERGKGGAARSGRKLEGSGAGEDVGTVGRKDLRYVLAVAGGRFGIRITVIRSEHVLSLYDYVNNIQFTYKPRTKKKN